MTGRVLVTGGSGYIGSHIVQSLEAAGHELIIVDVRPPPAGLFGRAVVSAVGDVRDAQFLDSAFADAPVSGVIHLAGLKSVAESMRDPAAYFDANVVGTLRVLEAMQRAGVGSLVYSSSAAVYGTPDVLPIDEDAAPHPENPYGESKLLAERMLEWFDRAHGIRHFALRYFNAAGAATDGSNGEDWRLAVNLVPIAIESALGRRQPLDIYGNDFPTADGTAVRDYIHVVDLARAHVLALDRLASGAASATLNLGTGRGASVLEVVRNIERLVGGPVPHRMAPRRRGDPAAVWADARRAAAILGWTAEYGIEDIVGSAVAWQRTAQLGELDGAPTRGPSAESGG